jgi:DNA-binding transcriptional MerR regulator
MRIGELATATGVSASRIRFYETAGLLVPDGRTEAGYRIYGEPALRALRIIEQAQLAGFTLAEIKALVPPSPGKWNREELLAALRRKLTAVEEMQQQLSRSEYRLRAVIDDIDATPVSAACAETEDRIVAKVSSLLAKNT